MHGGAGHNAAAANQRINCGASPAGIVEDKFGGGDLFLARPDGPIVIVEIEFGGHTRQLHIGLPVGIDGTDVAPATQLVLIHILEWVRIYAPGADRIGNNILTEIVL